MTETTEEDAYTRADKASLITEEQRQAYSATRDRIRAEARVAAYARRGPIPAERSVTVVLLPQSP